MEILTTLPQPARQPETPQLAERPISEDLDYYKATMSQFFYRHDPDTQVTFTFHNRGQQRILDYVDPSRLQEHFDAVQTQGWTVPELQRLGQITINGGQRAFSDEYLGYLREAELPPVEITYDEKKDDIVPRTTGDWPLVTFWETVVMREISRQYFEGYLQAEGIPVARVQDEGDRILDENIAQLKSDPTLKVMEFGTRRAFSPAWHRHVVERLAEECPENLLGTSNIGYAELTGTDPKGTTAHEADMVFTALADARGQDMRGAHGQFLDKWYDFYGHDYSVALTDTFTSDFFFRDFGSERAARWKGVRQDSGDPFVFGRKLVDFYRRVGVDPATKVCTFSDALTVQKSKELHQEFGGAVIDAYGIGTKFSNDLGLKPLNTVMKATHAYDPAVDRGAYTVKMSDDAGKHTGPDELFPKYQTTFTS